MAKITGLKDNEKDILKSAYQKKVDEADEHIKEWVEIKNNALERIADIDGEEGSEQKSASHVHSSVQKAFDLLGQPIIDIEQANTFSKKVQYTFNTKKVEMSTGEAYTALIDYFSVEGAKNKDTVVQTLSKELGKNAKSGKIYYQSQSKDGNGKLRFGLLEWKSN